MPRNTHVIKHHQGRNMSFIHPGQTIFVIALILDFIVRSTNKSSDPEAKKN